MITSTYPCKDYYLTITLLKFVCQCRTVNDKGCVVSLINWIKFQSLGDERGSLVALEIGKERAVPFEIKRVYYIYRTSSGVSRGFHAHRNLKQVAICVAGQCRMLLDDGQFREETWMCNPTQGLLIDSMVWREMHDFSDDCVLLVLASEHYDEADYIRSYTDFIEQVTHA